MEELHGVIYSWLKVRIQLRCGFPILSFPLEDIPWMMQYNVSREYDYLNISKDL